MTRRTLAVAGGAALSGALFVFAFVAAPHSCQWGNDAYFWSGVACLVMLFAMPFAFRAAESIVGRAGLALGFVVFGCGVWFAGLAAANFRIICKLF
jgi:hypothetical protein